MPSNRNGGQGTLTQLTPRTCVCVWGGGQRRPYVAGFCGAWSCGRGRDPTKHTHVVYAVALSQPAAMQLRRRRDTARGRARDIQREGMGKAVVEGHHKG